jgi:hypothetical protein
LILCKSLLALLDVPDFPEALKVCLQLHEVTGDHDGATTGWSQAHAIFERLNTPEADETSSSTD